jgi:hypothetical protein
MSGKDPRSVVNGGFRFGDVNRCPRLSVSFLAVRSDRALAVLAVLAGVVLIVIAIVYWVEPARSLPGFFPGHEAGSSHHHVKHGVAAFLVGLACFAFAWFRSGPKSVSTT